MVNSCRIVLVRPHYPGNLGAAARVMRNFGLTDLVLVDPVCSTHDLEARRLATHGLAVLDAARVVPDLGTALADCVFTLATSALKGGVVREGVVGTPKEQFPILLDAAEIGPVALVFGPEPHGLDTAEVSRCHGLVHIPVDPAFPALNLAQAIAISCYELHTQCKASTATSIAASVAASGRRESAVPAHDAENAKSVAASGRRESAVPAHDAEDATSAPLNSPLTGAARPGVARRAIATHHEQERAFDHLREAFTAVGFLFGTRADALMHAVRQLIGRAQPTPQEVKILHGLARQLLFVAGQREHPGEPQA